jgi:HAMP domain-containing protein
VDVKGEILELKNTINTMVDQLRSFASEVTRVAREVGTEGRLGGQADVPGVAGTWKDLTDSVNSMASNLTDQVRGIAKVVTAVADGDLKQKLTVEAKGEVAALAETINSMIDTLATFAEQVTSVAREVGVEGQLGGQAKVPGAAGTWKDLTENVNQLAENLTTQVRAIAEVATAVTQGDLTRSITVQAKGEVAALKDTINEMIRNLRDTTQKNTEQDWLKTNLAKFSRMLQGQRDLNTVGRLILSELAPVVTAQHAEFYVLSGGEDVPHLTLLASYASAARPRTGGASAWARASSASAPSRSARSSSTTRRRITCASLGPGQRRAAQHPRAPGGVRKPGARRARARLVRRLQRHPPGVPRPADGIDRHRDQHDRGEHADGRPPHAVADPRAGAAEPPGGTADDEPGAAGEGAAAGAPEPGGGAQEPRGGAGPPGAGRKGPAARPHVEVQVRVPREHVARAAHAAQLAPHPFRPAFRKRRGQPHEQAGGVRAHDPLVGQRPADAHQRHPRPLEDRVGTVAVDIGEVRLDELQRFVERTFRHVAETKSLKFEIRMDPRLPKSISTDAKRLQQILRNLLSNAFKFTHQGDVNLVIRRRAPAGARTTRTSTARPT